MSREKLCRDCRQRKPLADFYRQPRATDGHMHICKECHKTAMILRSRTNLKVQEYDRKRAKEPHRKVKSRPRVPRWRADNPARYRASNAINNAIRDGKIKRGARCACGSTANIRGIASDLEHPLRNIIWQCAKGALEKAELQAGSAHSGHLGRQE